MARFEHEFEISFRDVGKSNQLSNRALISFMEDTAGMHSNSLGYGMNNIEKIHFTWVLLYWKIRIVKRPLYSEKIRVSTWSRETVKFYAFRDFEVYDSTGEVIGIATSKWLLLNADTMAIGKIDPQVAAAYCSENVPVFEEEPEINKLTEPDNYSATYSYTVQRKDIDINNHMHNVSYLDLAYEVLPEQLYNNVEFNDIEIMYKKEIKLGEVVRCLYTEDTNSHYVTIKSEDESILHAIVKFS